MHALELLNAALQTVTDSAPFGGNIPGGEETWAKMMQEQTETAERRNIPAENEQAGLVKSDEQPNIEQGEDVPMTDT